MKRTTILILFIIGIVAITAVTVDPALDAECTAQANVSVEDARFNNEGLGYLNHPEKAPRTTKCYYDCMLKKLDMFDASGNIKVDVITKFMIKEGLDKSTIESSIAKCSILNGADDCEKMFNYRLCMYQETKN